MIKKFITKNQYINNIYKVVSSSLLFPPLVVLIAILIITIWPWQNAQQNLSTNINRSMDDIVQEVEGRFNEKFISFRNTLQNGVALHKSSTNLTNKQWNTFYSETETIPENSGIQAVAYIRNIQNNNVSQFESFMINQGIENFAVRPATDKASYSVVSYLYPDNKTSQPIIGLDIATAPDLNQAMIKAARTGTPALTDKVKLIQKVDERDRHGFVLFVPFYKIDTAIDTESQRTSAIDGYVAGSFRIKQFFGTIAEQPNNESSYALKIYESELDESNLMFQTDNFDSINEATNLTEKVKPIKVFDRTWQFVFTFNEDKITNASERNAPTLVLAVGVITAFLVFSALLSIFKSRARELQEQKEREVNVAKDELVSLASHQMRTPATGVKQYLGMVLQGFAGDIDESQKTLLEKAYKSNERQLHVINQILHLAKLESGRIVLAKHETNLNELIADVIEEQRSEADNRGHTLKIRIPKKPIIQSIDSHMMRMALENILSNAIKYTVESGTVSVRLSRSKGHIKIVIKDTGVGIDQKVFPEIFKQFTRLYDEKTEQVSGTGVGLYLADQLVRLHKGTLEVTSEIGVGSEFTITLPNKPVKKQ